MKKGQAKAWKTNMGKLFLISGPSGVGKGTVCREIFKKDLNLYFSVSATTRSPRKEDKEGVTYFFKTKDEFESLIDEGAFLEWAQYNGNYYGTLKAPVLKNLEEGKNVILEIDVKGALQVMENYTDGVYIFIAPPDEKALFDRLKNRGSETDEEIERRLGAAKEELKLKDRYDYVVINDVVENAVLEIEKIINKEND